MNYRSIDFVKGEFVGSGSLQSWDNEELMPQPYGALLETGPPAFLSKTYDFVEDPSTNGIVSWSLGNNSFIVWDPQKFAMNLLPNYFKHKNFSSFVRQLNTYGFKKVNPDRWEFANEGFLRGQRHLLKGIIRRKTQCLSSQTSIQSLHSCVGGGSFGLDEEIDRLSRNKQVLEMELVKLRQQQRTTLSYLQTMEQRLKRAEMEQKHTISLFVKALQNPTLLQRILPKAQRKDVEELISNKRRRTTLNHVSKNDVGAEELVFHERENTIDVCFPELGHESEENADKNDADGDFNVKLDSQVCCEIPRFGDLELEKLALSMQKPQVIMEEKLSSEKGDCKPTDEGIWEELIYEMIHDEIWTLGVEEGVDDLVGSSLKYKPADEGFREKWINEGIDEIGTLDDEEGGEDLAEKLGFLVANLR